MAVFSMGMRRWRNAMMMADDGDAQSDGWRTMGEATAEGRLDNCSPRLACLPGVGV